MRSGRKRADKTAPESPRPRRRTSLSRVFFSLFMTLVIMAAAALVAFIAVWSQISATGPLKSERAVLIPAGVSTRAIAARLEREGVVRSGQMVLAAVLIDRALGRAASLKAGEFAIPAGASVRQVLEIIRSGKAIVHKVTIPEGFSVVQIVERLRNHPELTGEIGELPPEGTLLPQTYVFERGASRMDILRRMRKAQEKLMAKLWPERAAGLPFRTPREALILASIVEKETGLAEERPRVAAVFINRLKKGVRLQSDPTIIYGITRGKPLGRPIRKSEIAAKTPWNTYQIDGLPKTPIANPGEASIRATLHPAETDELYFVADGKGGHIFAATLAKHNENVRKWRATQALKSAGETKGAAGGKGGKTGGKKGG